MNVSELLTLLLGGGAVATLGALFQGIRSLQNGARTREKETVKELVKQRKQAWIERDNSNAQADYWRRWAAIVEYEASRNGLQLPPRPPEPTEKKYEDEESNQ